jgi:hypothetical protein
MFTLAPVLERLVLVRAREQFVAWLTNLADLDGVKQLIGAHYDGPQSIQSKNLATYAVAVENQNWAPSEGSWQTLAAIDQTLLKWKLVPEGERIRE